MKLLIVLISLQIIIVIYNFTVQIIINLLIKKKYLAMLIKYILLISNLPR